MHQMQSMQRGSSIGFAMSSSVSDSVNRMIKGGGKCALHCGRTARGLGEGKA